MKCQCIFANYTDHCIIFVFSKSWIWSAFWFDCWKWKGDACRCQIGNVLSFSTLWPNMEMLLHNRLHITNLKIIHLSLFYNVLGNHLLIILFFSVSLIIINKTFSFSLIVILLLSILLFFSHFALCVLLKIVLSYYGRYEFYVNIL